VHWINLGLIWAVLRRWRRGDVAAGLVVYGWNPLVIFEFGANGHNDGVMIAFLLLAMYFLARDAGVRGVGAIVLSYCCPRCSGGLRASCAAGLGLARSQRVGSCAR
jgi:hypothetical protein